MEKIITRENIRRFAYVNENMLKGDICAVVVHFYGLGNMTIFNEDHDAGEFLGENGMLYVVPYNNPWAWMNRQAVTYTDEILDVLFDVYDISDSTPIIYYGISMGGQSALVYSAYSKRTPDTCIVNCPVCDTLYHFTERDDLPRTLYSALFNEDGSLEDALKRISPVHIIDKMPKIKYRIFHSDTDKSVNIDAHSRKFVSALEARGFDVTLNVLQGRAHCDLTLDAKRKLVRYIFEAVEK